MCCCRITSAPQAVGKHAARAIWGPYGNVVEEASREREEVITALLDPAVLADVRERETVLADFKAHAEKTAGGYVAHRLD